MLFELKQLHSTVLKLRLIDAIYISPPPPLFYRLAPRTRTLVHPLVLVTSPLGLLMLLFAFNVLNATCYL